MTKLLEHASTNIPFYKNYFKNNPYLDLLDINNYPVIEKEYIAKNLDLFNIIDENSDDYIVYETSGSTGIPLKVYKYNKDKMAQLRCLWNIRKKQYNVSPSAKCFTFHFNKFNNVNARDQEIIITDRVVSINAINLNSPRLPKNLEIITEFDPEYIMCTPSVLCDILRYYEKYQISPPKNIRYIELMSEYLFDYQKEYIKKIFNVPISNQYGCTEVFGIAQYSPECDELQVINDNVYVEILKDGIITTDPNVEGEILITGLNSFGMPFIRYKLGDLGKIVTSKYPRKSDTTIIEILAGRLNDYIMLEGGKRQHSSILCSIIDNLNAEKLGIKKYKIIQIELFKFEVLLCVEDSNQQDKIKKEFVEKAIKIGLIDFSWKFKFVELSDFKTEKNKFLYFENKIKN